MANVALRNVTKVYPGDVLAVVDASLEVQDQEFVVLVGPSGCGKSTTLRMVAGLEEATSGDILIDEERVNDTPPKNRDIAMVFQNYALYPHMTVYKNMAFGLKLRKYPKAEIDQRVRDAADILGITRLLDRKPKALSGGERQRVAVGRAIVRHPKVFLFDEPLSNLDAKLRVQMRTEISKLHTRLQATMVYVTHDQTEAMTMGDRIVVMNDGIIQQIDDPLTLYHSPVNRFVASFIGSPPMNFMDGELARDAGDLRFQAGNLSLAIPQQMTARLDAHGGAKVTFGIRPEDVLARDIPEGTAVPARAEVVEPLGSEVILYLDIGGSPIVGKVDASVHPEPNSQLTIGFRMQRCHFFDADTGEVIV